MYKSPEINPGGPAVSYLGPRGTYSEEAVYQRFGTHVELNPVQSISAALGLVENRGADYAVIPLKNSTTRGLVRPAELALTETELSIVGEELLAIKHTLLAPKGVLIEDIKTVYGHDQTIAQCRQTIGDNLPDADLTLASSNTAAIDKVLRRTDAAILASRKVAKSTPLRVVLDNMHDHEDNHTRFIVLSRHETQPTGNDKTSILCQPEDKPGGLRSMLGPLADRDISMNEIHSREIREGGHSMYIEIEGHIQEDPVAQAVEEMGRRSADLQVLGSYPKAELVQ